jgi:NO-binding membrane sensor protein with MHYT domain
VTVNDLIHAIAGSFILLSLARGVPASPVFHSAYWLWFTAFVGANLRQFGFTKACPLGYILKKLGVKESCATAS